MIGYFTFMALLIVSLALWAAVAIREDRSDESDRSDKSDRSDESDRKEND